MIWLACWLHKDFLVRTSTLESCFKKSDFYQKEAKNARKTIMRESVSKDPQRSSNKAYARSCKELCQQIAGWDVMDAVSRSKCSNFQIIVAIFGSELV